ncbi:exodeoxyribonuclease V subunit alpha [Thermomonas sp.]|uniref:exodeoxyribonuclease V subunit alpha n=1 Tax=Thermomonas sp. TaxID=1971895 RepID=UPI003D0FD46F
MSAYTAGEAFGFARRQKVAHGPDEWRDLDRAVWRWVMAHGGDEVTACAAAWASHAEGQGHSALPLAYCDGSGRRVLDDRQCDALARSPLVAAVHAGDAAEGRPFVLDGEHFYLLRNHRAEVEVARALRTRRDGARTPRCPIGDDDLRALFNGSWQDAEERQRAAVRQAIGRRLMVLTGGPGTGKTTTVLRMLLGLSREHAATTGGLPRLRIAAPTGKAAQRLAESLRQGVGRLHAGAQPIGAQWSPHLEAVLAADAATVHRLLGSRGRHGGYAFHADEPLPADIVVIDEASMLDLGLLRALLSALREDAVLVLVGDADQLTSVGTGSVMMDIVQALEADPRGDLVRLSHCFRADGALVPINEAVRAGDAAAFDAALAAATGAAIVHAVPDVASLRRRLSAWARDLQTALEAVAITTPVAAHDQIALAARLAVLHRQQLLCALREGPFGATQAATAIAARLRAWDALSAWSSGAWYPGRCVLVTRNDHAARLYNGDVGVCVLVENGDGRPLLQVAFERMPEASSVASSTTGAGVRLFDPNTLPPHEDAFALTVHKSQGSEYGRVAVLLPPDPGSPLLVRQMLYTGLSRARASLELWAMPDVVAKALSTALRRHGRLAERISSGVAAV